MRVYLTKEVLNDQRFYDLLDQILFLFESGQHRWDMLNPEDITTSEWYNDPGRAGKRVRNHLKRLGKKSFRERVGRKIEISNCKDPSNNRYAPENALALLSRPLKVYVENKKSDGDFLKLLINLLGTQMLKQSLHENWLELQTGGGASDMTNQLDLDLANHEELRCYVLADSDAPIPGEIGEYAQRIKVFCNEKGIPCTILSKRTIENYLPTDSLQTLNDKNSVYTAYKEKLDDTQKDHYHMKKGFQIEDNKRNNNIPTNQKALYDNLDDKTIQDLQHGFGNNVSALFENQGDLINEANLRKRCGANGEELQNLLGKITEYL